MTTTTIRIQELPPTLSPLIGRADELSQAIRTLGQPSHHALLLGQSGSGKSTLAQAILRERAAIAPSYQLDLTSIVPSIISGEPLVPILRALEATAQQLAPATFLIDDLQQLGLDDPVRLEVATQLLQPLVTKRGLSLLVTLTRQAATQAILKTDFLNRWFTPIELVELTDEQAVTVIEQTKSGRRAERSAILEAIRLGRRYGSRALPDSALRLIERATLESPTITLPAIQQLVADDTGIPLAAVQGAERDRLATLADTLNRRVVGQSAALTTIAGTIQRARLGLADPNRPRGSFLLLGPSGVGKTETAKVLSEILFGSTDAMVRLDMSEYGEAHSAVRLTGAPPGYVGYEAGGQLTNPIHARPYSLVLLDELEKAHARLHDTFLQVLDDGRLTDATGQLVDFRETVILATSNVASRHIVDNAERGINIHERTFFDDTVLPELLQHFRPEFINRFDAVLMYEPLSEDTLASIAQLGLEHLAQRLSERSIAFEIPAERLHAWLAPLRNPLLGARPVRRMLSDRLETPLARYLLDHPDATQFTITGDEPWLS